MRPRITGLTDAIRQIVNGKEGEVEEREIYEQLTYRLNIQREQREVTFHQPNFQHSVRKILSYLVERNEIIRVRDGVFVSRKEVSLQKTQIDTIYKRDSIIATLDEINDPVEFDNKIQKLAKSKQELRNLLGIMDSESQFPRRVLTQVEVTNRNRNLANALKKFHEYKCQFCGYTFKEKNGNQYCEEHHIKQIAKDGLDASNNIIILCANHHEKITRANVEQRLSGTIMEFVFEDEGPYNIDLTHPI